MKHALYLVILTLTAHVPLAHGFDSLVANVLGADAARKCDSACRCIGQNVSACVSSVEDCIDAYDLGLGYGLSETGVTLIEFNAFCQQLTGLGSSPTPGGGTTTPTSGSGSGGYFDFNTQEYVPYSTGSTTTSASSGSSGYFDVNTGQYIEN